MNDLDRRLGDAGARLRDTAPSPATTEAALRSLGDVRLDDERDAGRRRLWIVAPAVLAAAAAAVVGVIERRWTVAALWCLCAAALSATGLMHSYQWTAADTTLKLTPAWPFVWSYLAMAGLFFTARWTTE